MILKTESNGLSLTLFIRNRLRVLRTPVLCAALIVGTFYPQTGAADEAGEQAWPSTRREDEGMMWYWPGQGREGIVVDAEENWVRDGQGIPRRGARHDWFGGIEAHDGFLEAADTGPALAQALMLGRQFHVEMSLIPPMEGAATGTLLWMGSFEMKTLWHLSIHTDGLLIVRHGEEVVELIPINTQKPLHLGLSFTEKGVDLWINGKRTLQKESAILPKIEDPWDLIVGFGGGAPDLPGWRGAMEQLALYTVAPSFEASASAWEKERAARNPPKWIRIEAELVAEAARPDPEPMTDYGQALLGRIWKPVSPDEAPAELEAGFFTWQWLYLDNRFLESATPLEPGARKELIISSAEDQPQLEEIQQIIEGLDPMDFIELESFFIQDLPPATGQHEAEESQP